MNSFETHYEVKVRRFQCCIKCFISNLNKKQWLKALFSYVFANVLSSSVKVMLADSHHVPKNCLAWIVRSTRWHFQHKHMIMCSALPVRSLLAQPVSQGTGTQLWCQSGLSCASLQGHDPCRQMEAALHSHTHTYKSHNVPFSIQTRIVHLFAF